MRYIFPLLLSSVLCYGFPSEKKPVSADTPTLNTPCAPVKGSPKKCAKKNTAAAELRWQCRWRSAPLKFAGNEDSAVCALFAKHGLHPTGQVPERAEIILDTASSYDKDFFALLCDVSHSVGICPEKIAGKRLTRITVRLRERVWDGDSTSGTAYTVDSSIVAAYICLPKYVPGFCPLSAHAELMPENFDFPSLNADAIDSILITESGCAKTSPEQISLTAPEDLAAFAQLMKQCKKRRGEFIRAAHGQTDLYSLRIRYEFGSQFKMNLVASNGCSVFPYSEEAHYVAPAKLLPFIRSRMPKRPNAGEK